MKKINIALQYIIALILSLTIIAFILINMFSSTILNKNYIMSELENENYYEKIYEEVEANFENYINQSGLEEEVLDGIVSREKVEQDTKKIIDNIFSGGNETISTDEIKNELEENIRVSLKRALTKTEQESVNTFVNTICNEYKSTILSTKYENDIHSMFNKVSEYLSSIKKIILITSFICVALIIILSIKQLYQILARIGVSITISGLLLLISRIYIISKTKISDITILNNTISIVIRNVITNILNIINKNSIILLIIGIVFILLYAIIKSTMEAKKIKEQYTPEK